jgi:glycine/D-amino acid oxidase-like deaminating enzyme
MSGIVVVGAGIFGVSAAIELQNRGHSVRLLDPGPLPRQLAASTDISKVVRLEYGSDEGYTALSERSIEGWHRWNRDFGVELYHETGLLLLRRTPLAPGTLEQDSFDVLSRRGHKPEKLDADAIRARFPAWSAERYAYGTYNPEGGFVESGRVIGRLVEEARKVGVEIHEGKTFGRLLSGPVAGVLSTDGQRFEAEQVILAMGSWTPHALPWLSSEFRSTGHPVFHLVPDDPALFRSERFPVFGADISSTGYYGFPLHPLNAVVKIGRHGPGRLMHPESPERIVTAQETEHLRAFLVVTFPRLADARIVDSRICLYCDSWDGHFWIAHDPDHPGLVLATGDSGHAFKFGPALGPLIADVVEGRGEPLHAKFRWRPGLRPARSEEAMRSQADT